MRCHPSNVSDVWYYRSYRLIMLKIGYKKAPVLHRVGAFYFV
jgi:hypothetical protein